MVSCSESLERAKKKSRPYRISFYFGWRQRKNCSCLSYKMTTELSSLSSHSPRLCLAIRRPRQVSTLMLYYVNPSDYTLKIVVSIEWFGSAGGLDPCKPKYRSCFAGESIPISPKCFPFIPSKQRIRNLMPSCRVVTLDTQNGIRLATDWVTLGTQRCY